jgi:hypothetical protein
MMNVMSAMTGAAATHRAAAGTPAAGPHRGSAATPGDRAHGCATAGSRCHLSAARRTTLGRQRCATAEIGTSENGWAGRLPRHGTLAPVTGAVRAARWR